MYRKKTMMNLKKLLLGSAVAVALVGCSATNQTSTQPSTKEDVQKKTDTSLEKTTTESADKEKKEDVAEKKDEKTEEKSEEKSEEKKEENAQDQQKKVLIGEWKLNSVKVNDKTYTLEELKTILQEEAYKKNLLGFTFTEKEVSMTVDGADKGTTSYHYNEKDDTWEDETARLKFKVEGETLSLVEGNTTYLFAK